MLKMAFHYHFCKRFLQETVTNEYNVLAVIKADLDKTFVNFFSECG